MAEQSYAWLMMLGDQAHEEDQFRDAASLYEQAWQQAEGQGNPEQAMRARYWLADAMRMSNHYLEAIPHFSAVIATREQLPGTDWANRIGRAYAHLVNCSRNSGSANKADLEPIIQQGLAWSEAQQCYGAQINLHEQHAQTLSLSGETDTAIQAQERALATRRRHPNVAAYTFPGVANRLADLLSERADNDDQQRAKALYQEALEHADAVPFTRRWSYEGLADLALAQNQPQLARQYLNDALREARQTQGPGILLTYIKLIDLALEQDDVLEAETYLRTAASHCVRDLAGVAIPTRLDLLRRLALYRQQQAASDANNPAIALRLRQAIAAYNHALRYARRLDRVRLGDYAQQVKQEIATLGEQLAKLNTTAKP